MKSIRNILNRLLEAAGSLILAEIVVMVLYQVFTRTVLNSPSTRSEELVRFSLVWLAMLTAAYVTGKKAHLVVTMLSDHLKPPNRKTLDIIVQALFLAFSIMIMIAGGVKAVSVTLTQYSPSLGIPMGFIYLSVPVSGFFMMIYSFLNVYGAVKTPVLEYTRKEE